MSEISKIMKNEEAIASMMAQVNPFMVTDKKGELCRYQSQIEAYHQLLMLIFRECTKGYLEIEFLLIHMYPTKPWRKIRQMAGDMKDNGCPDYFMFDFGKARTDKLLEQLFVSLHTVVNTPYNSNAFKSALMLAHHSFELFLIRKNTKK